MLNVRFDSEKAVEAILYVASVAPIPDIYHVGKILYFADRLHLEHYGRLITGDNYLAMKDGPVAENAYDIIKIARGDGRFIPNGCDIDIIRSALSVDGSTGNHQVHALRNFNEDVFSDSDIDCINEAIEKYGNLSFKEIRDISHDSVWMAADQNGEIPLEVIAASCKDGDKLVAYLTSAE
ncbi:Panacea domain-containing protein [Photorhabdus antumapuensis]|uniref:Panacea domain-containing protein n=1 Tax=Photorhabdus antumapuensis TaxID=2862867 RepID=UPI001CED582B|nr:Panacea domain-containing protein [Photorhabdus antumapuensis]MCA6222573.1 SocA family protein [Photorhabdus antumapuensis]